MTFEEWLNTNEGRMAAFEQPRKMCEIVWQAAQKEPRAEITRLEALLYEWNVFAARLTSKLNEMNNP